MNGVIVTGTDTGIGKTVAAAMLTLALDGVYYKPIQSGLDDETDTAAVLRMTGLTADRALPEAYRLTRPLSPHRAAELDGVVMDLSRLDPPRTDRFVVVEGAGGLLVPVTRDRLQVDVFKTWGLPVVLCARTALGTINHSLLSIEALKARNIPVVGVLFIGDEVEDSEHTICEIGGVKRLGRLPWLDTVTPDALRTAFADNFNRADFGGPK
ncbi:MAG: ATP-dependent dethiobiotin synthetase BioD [Alphaproteobacteria bacterium]|nr:ATP-dependent dethiobiotin synthetase BioD [Alphaproteobacteria bacterium]